MLNPRRLRFWVLTAALLYTLLGFFLVPVIVKNSVVDLIQDDLGRTARINKVVFNPFVLSLAVRDFEMRDTDGVRLAAFDEFFVNFQLSSLFRQAWTLRKIHLAGCYFFFERFDENQSRLSRLLADLAENQAPGHNPDEQGGLPRLLIPDLSLSDCSLDLSDQSIEPTAVVGIRNLQIKLNDISNQDPALFPLSLAGSLSKGGSFGLDAKLGLFPAFSLVGNFHTQGVPLSLAQPYVQQFAARRKSGSTGRSQPATGFGCGTAQRRQRYHQHRFAG